MASNRHKYMIKWGCSNTSLFVLSRNFLIENKQGYFQEGISVKVSERVYISEILKLQKKRLLRRIQEEKAISRLYCITLPLWGSAFLEIYPYNELLSDIHAGKDITIVGMAAGKDDAVVMLRRMIDDLYHKGKLKDVTTYFCGEDK